MGENIVLRLRYIHLEYVEIKVGDPDQSNLLDLYVDLLEGDDKIGMRLPEQPILWYTFNSQNFQLKNDSDLMKRFNSFHENKLINMVIGSGESPCKNLELARGLIESKKHVDNAVTPRSSHGTTSMDLPLHKPRKKVPATTARRRGTHVSKVRRTCMVRHCERQEYIRKLHVAGITEEAQAILDKALTKSRKLEVFKASEFEYEVKDGNSSLPVHISNRTCACSEWQISGIPCKHAVRVITEMRGLPQLYVCYWYSIEMLRRTYSINYKVVPDEEQWPIFDFLTISPSTIKRGVGRPPRNRKRQAGQKEKGKRSHTVRCGKCKAFGHNATTCKGGLTARERHEQEGGRVQKTHKRARKAKTSGEGGQSMDEGGRVQKRHKRAKKATTSDDGGQSVEDIMSSATWVQGSQFYESHC